ncbi:MAG: hypothetical protein II169_00235 [Lachnospiraceae bacterium]|nr:hypothetical protein [Lachnospiraceae bacterium]
MSQEKVDQKKELKKNRKKIVKKNKRNAIIGTVCGVVVTLGIVGWLGYSGYSKYEAYQEENAVTTAIDLSAITDYESSITTVQSEDTNDTTTDDTNTEDSATDDSSDDTTEASEDAE